MKPTKTRETRPLKALSREFAAKARWDGSRRSLKQAILKNSAGFVGRVGPLQLGEFRVLPQPAAN
jgi:hypothetical protein